MSDKHVPCAFCGAPACVHLTEITGNKVTKLHMCEACAAKKGAAAGPSSPAVAKALAMFEMPRGGAADAPFPLAAISAVVQALASLITTGDAALSPPKEKKKCPVCGLTADDFEKTHRLGCANCYKVFAAEVRDLLPHIQPGPKHYGKTPPAGDAETGAAGSAAAASAAAPVPEKPLSREELLSAINRARSRMNAAVKVENYEEAARCRDEARDLETKLANLAAATGDAAGGAAGGTP